MLIRVGMEENPGILYTAWALDFPGCFAYGKDEAEALLNLPRELLEFDYWVRLHTAEPWFELDGMDFHVDETFTVFRIQHKGHEYEVNAFFQDDLRPLTSAEIEQALKVLQWQQEELLAGIEFLTPDQLNLIREGQRWSILGIVRHVAQAELWYLGNLGITTPQLSSDEDPVSAIEKSYIAIVDSLSGLIGDNRQTEYAQEVWTVRKFVRRLLWHRRDHIDHIRQLLGVI